MANVTLTKDETVLKESSFMHSISLFFLKSNFTLTNKRLMGEVNNTFWIIPVGKNQVTYPLSNIAGIRLDRKLRIKGILLGLVLSVIGLATLAAGIGIILLILGLVGILNGVQTLIVIQNNSGASMAHSITPFDAAAANELINSVNHAIAERM